MATHSGKLSVRRDMLDRGQNVQRPCQGTQVCGFGARQLLLLLSLRQIFFEKDLCDK
jgi:hypothetical protein